MFIVILVLCRQCLEIITSKCEITINFFGNTETKKSETQVGSEPFGHISAVRRRGDNRCAGIGGGGAEVGGRVET